MNVDVDQLELDRANTAPEPIDPEYQASKRFRATPVTCRRIQVYRAGSQETHIHPDAAHRPTLN